MVPSEIELQETSERGIRLIFPRRTFSPITETARMLMQVGGFLFVVPFVFSLVALVFTAFLPQPIGVGGFGLFIPLVPLVFFGLICFPLGSYLFLSGAYRSVGHCEITLESGKLILTHRWRSWKRTKRRPLERLRGVRVGQMSALALVTPGGLVTADSPWRLEFDFVSGNMLPFAEGYPREWLLAVAEEIGRHCQEVSSVPVQVDQATSPSDPPQQRRNQPTNSTVVFVEQPGGFTITIPRRGIWNASDRFFIVFTLFWNIFIWPLSILILSIMTQEGLQGGKANPGPMPHQSFMYLFFVPFWGVGLGCLLAILHRGCRSFFIKVEEDSLFIQKIGFLFSSRYPWTANELRRIEVGDTLDMSEVRLGSRAGFLRIVPKSGSSTSLLYGRDYSELEWIATHLRQTLRLESFAGTAATPLPMTMPVAEEDIPGPASSSVPISTQQEKKGPGVIGGVVSLLIFGALLYFCSGGGQLNGGQIVGRIFLCSGGLLFLVGLVVGAWTTWMVLRGTRADGTVIAMEARTSHDSEGRRSITWAPRVRFTDAEGTIHEATSSVSNSPPSFRTGDVVGIIYNPSNPTTFIVDTFAQKWMLPLICAFFVVVFGVIGMALTLATK